MSKTIKALAEILRKAQGVTCLETRRDIDVGKECMDIREDWNAMQAELAKRREGKMDYIDQMVDEFLRWKLPADFAPDGGISRNFGHVTPASPLWPVGTNLFTAAQARDMFKTCAHALIEDLARKDADCQSNGRRVTELEAEIDELIERKRK